MESSSRNISREASIVHLVDGPAEVHTEATEATEALSGCGFDRRRVQQIGPFVGAPHDVVVGRTKPPGTKPPGTVASPVPVDEQLMSPKRASSKAKTSSGFCPGRRRSRLRLTASADGVGEVFLKASCSLFGVGLLVPGAARLELDLAPPQELTLTDAVGVSVLDAMREVLRSHPCCSLRTTCGTDAPGVAQRSGGLSQQVGSPRLGHSSGFRSLSILTRWNR